MGVQQLWATRWVFLPRSHDGCPSMSEESALTGDAFALLEIDPTGLGSSLSYPAIPAPTEVPFRRSPAYQGSSRPNTLECVRIAAGGNVSYFVVEADDGKTVDLLAVSDCFPSRALTRLRVCATNPLS